MSNVQWKPIEEAPVSRKMIVVKAINTENSPSTFPYTTDPYCVWQEQKGHFVRWPHDFAPTHYCELPEHN